MNRERFGFSAYEYLTFLIPGSVLAFTLYYGWNGWRLGEPGAGAILGLALASYTIGHFVAALANWLEPVWWGMLPGHSVPSHRGLFGPKGVFTKEEEVRIKKIFAERFPRLEEFQTQFRAAYVDAHQGPLGAKLQTFVEQIGFYRSMATVSLLSLLAVSAFGIFGRRYLSWIVWMPTYLAATLLFAARYRRFWTRVGEYVVNLVLGTGGSSSSA